MPCTSTETVTFCCHPTQKQNKKGLLKKKVLKVLPSQPSQPGVARAEAEELVELLQVARVAEMVVLRLQQSQQLGKLGKVVLQQQSRCPQDWGKWCNTVRSTSRPTSDLVAGMP